MIGTGMSGSTQVRHGTGAPQVIMINAGMIGSEGQGQNRYNTISCHMVQYSHYTGMTWLTKVQHG